MDARFWSQENADFLQIGGAGVVPLGDKISTHVDETPGETFEIINDGVFIVVECEVGNHRMRSGLLASRAFTVTAADDTLTISGHPYQSGDGPLRVSNSGGALPAGLTAGTDYWVTAIDANTIKLSLSADRTSFVDITGAGTGTHSIGGSNGAGAVGFSPAETPTTDVANVGGKLLVPGEVYLYRGRGLTLRSYQLGDTVSFWVV